MKALKLFVLTHYAIGVASGQCGQSFEIDFNLKQRPLPPVQEVE